MLGKKRSALTGIFVSPVMSHTNILITFGVWCFSAHTEKPTYSYHCTHDN